MHSRLAAVIAAGVLAITGLATGTANAATIPTVSAVPECGKVTITVNNPTQFANLRLQYQTDRSSVRTVAVSASGTTAVPPIEFREDSGRHWVRWRLWGGPERDWDQPAWTVGSFTDFDPRGFRGQWAETVWVNSDCRPNRPNFERADAPSVVQPECGAERGKLVIPSDRGVVYKASRDSGPYRLVRAGEYSVRPAVYRVRAYALPGYRLVGDTRWTLTVEPAEPCPTPTPTPTVTVEPTPSPTPTPDPTDPDPTEEPEPEPVPTVTTTTTQTIVVRNYLPTRVDTGFGGTAK